MRGVEVLQVGKIHECCHTSKPVKSQVRKICLERIPHVKYKMDRCLMEKRRKTGDAHQGHIQLKNIMKKDDDVGLGYQKSLVSKNHHCSDKV